MEVRLQAPEGKFQIFLVDPSREQKFPGLVFDDFGPAMGELGKLNRNRREGEEYHIVVDDTGRIFGSPA